MTAQKTAARETRRITAPRKHLRQVLSEVCPLLYKTVENPDQGSTVTRRKKLDPHKLTLLTVRYILYKICDRS